MIKKTNFLDVFFVFFAIVYLCPFLVVVGWIAHGFVAQHNMLVYFNSASFFGKIYNSIILSTTVAIESVIVGFFFTFIFFSLQTPRQRSSMILFLLSLFATSPIIYLVGLTRLHWFNQLPVFWQSVQVLCLNMIPLSTIIFVFSIGILDKFSIENAIMLVRGKTVFHHIILPQVKFSVIGAFLMVFMMIFVHEEVPSFLGYRTYAQEFLSRIIAMESYQDASLAALPFLVVGAVVLGVIRWLFRNFSIINNYNLSLIELKFYWQRSRYIINICKIILVLFIFSFAFFLLNQFEFFSIEKLLNDNIKSINNTFFISFTTSIITTLLGGILYHRLITTKNNLEKLLWSGAMLFYWLIPSSLPSLALINLAQILSFNSIFFDYTVLFSGYFIKLLPISVVLFAVTNIFTYDRNDGFLKFVKISFFYKFIRVILPTYFYNWLIIYTIIFIFAMNEVSSTIMLIPPGVETIVIKIYNLLHYGDFSSIVFLSLVQISLVLICVLFSQLAMKLHD